MKKILLGISLHLMFFLTYSQSVPILDFNSFKSYLEKENDTTYVINFWATWCSPCVDELPYFLKANEEFKDEKFVMILVSLDFKRHIESRLLPFIEENNIKPRVVLLSDTDANSWINQVDSSWTGAIPASLIYNNKFRLFREGSFNYEELYEIISSNIQN